MAHDDAHRQVQTVQGLGSFTLEQAVCLMVAARGTRLDAYIVLSMLTGLRTEEVRALRWDHVAAWVGGQWQPVPWVRPCRLIR
jgi:integrase